VQRNAMQCWRTGEDFRQLLLSDAEVAAILSEEEINEIFDLGYHLKHVDEIYKRFDL
jgi:adenylosuccinate lyase